MIAAVGLVPSAPAQAEPDIDDVQARVDRLYHEAEQASERYNDAELELRGPRGRPRRARGRRGPPGRPARRRPRAGPGLHRPPVRGPEPGRRRPGRRLRRPAGLPLPALDDVGVQRHAVPALRRLRHRAEVARHPPRGHREARRRGRRDREEARRREGHDRREARRGRGPARRAQGRGARGHPVPRRRPHARPTSRPPAAPPPPSSTPWPRSATPTSTAPPARAPSTAPASR